MVALTHTVPLPGYSIGKERAISSSLWGCFQPADPWETWSAPAGRSPLWPVTCPYLLPSLFQIFRYLAGWPAGWGLCQCWLILMPPPSLAMPWLASTFLPSPPDSAQESCPCHTLISKLISWWGSLKLILAHLWDGGSHRGEASAGDPIKQHLVCMSRYPQQPCSKHNEEDLFARGCKSRLQAWPPRSRAESS